MEERNNLGNQGGEGNLITDILLPSMFTILILFCLVQVGFSVWTPDGSDTGQSPESITAISAFAS